MRILTVDTSDRSIVGLVSFEGGVFAEESSYRAPDARRHVEALAPAVERVTAVARPDAVVVGTGPAAFTGLRAGLVTARALARGWGVPVYGVSSLEALALGVGEGDVLAAIDAKRRELFVLRARPMGADDVSVLSGPRIVAPEALPGILRAEPAVVATPDPGLHPELAGALQAVCEPVPMARLALSRLRRSQAGEDVCLGTAPQYLRRPDVHGGR